MESRDRPITYIQHTQANFCGWQGLAAGDYQFAAIRLVTLARSEVNHLVFASVELLPCEAKAPPAVKRSKNFGDDRLIFSRTVFPISEALDWYEAAWQGNTNAPGATVKIETNGLLPEPAQKRFVLRSDVPFSPVWHGSRRVHRLLPMNDPSEFIQEIIRGIATVSRWKNARIWLKEQLHFDVLAFDDWLGSIVVLAPDPLLRGHGVRLQAGPSGDLVKATYKPRRGANISSLQILFQERRAEGAGWRAETFLDDHNAVVLQAPGIISELGQQIICPVRGILHDDPAGHFFRSVSVSTEVTSGTRTGHPPARQGRRAPAPYVTSISRGPPQPLHRPDNPIQRISRLQTRRENRFGLYRPLSSDDMPEAAQIFEYDREGAVEFIRKQLMWARSKVVFVDPYFEAGDFVEFAYAIATEGVSVLVLISDQGHLARSPSGAPKGILTNGDWIEHQIAQMRVPGLYFGAVQVRVCNHRRFHDRFVLIDDALWHCGHSFNKVGSGEISIMSRLPRPHAVISLINSVSDEAEPFESYWARQRENVQKFDIQNDKAGESIHSESGDPRTCR